MDDFSQLAALEYSGRGLTIGMTIEGNHFLAYHITGRSAPSKSRKFVVGEKTGIIRTDVTDPQALKDGNPALLIYPALGNINDVFFGSNGIQTELIYSRLKQSLALKAGTKMQGMPIPDQILESIFEGEPQLRYDAASDSWTDITSYEPDFPNNTPRISAIVHEDAGALCRVSRGTDGNKKVEVYSRGLIMTNAFCMTTYRGGNESPLKPSSGKPLEARVHSIKAEDIAGSIHSAISHGSKPGENFAVAAAVLLYNKKTGLVERAITS